jgi:segregation and condensation protein A
VDQQPPEEEADEDDPRWELIRQLIEYKKFKEVAADLHVREIEEQQRFARAANHSPELALAPIRLGEVGIFQLINAFQNVIKRVEARQDLRELFDDQFTVSDKIEVILQRISSGRQLRFSALFEDIASRVEIVVTFLALLELIRLKQVRATQTDPLGEIEIAAAAG